MFHNKPPPLTQNIPSFFLQEPTNLTTCHNQHYDFVLQLISYLQTNGLKTPNLFGGGDKENVELLQNLLTKDHLLSMKEMTTDPRVVAEVLIQYFTSAQDPLLPSEMYDAFLLAQTILDSKAKIDYLRNLFSALPRKTQEFVDKLLRFLMELSRGCEVNFSDSESLAYLFGSILLRPLEHLYYMAKDQKAIVDLTKLFIQEADKFEPPPMMKYSSSAPNLVNMDPINIPGRKSFDSKAVDLP